MIQLTFNMQASDFLCSLRWYYVEKLYVLHLFSQVFMILCNLLSTVNYHEGDLNKVPSFLSSHSHKVTVGSVLRSGSSNTLGFCSWQRPIVDDSKIIQNSLMKLFLSFFRDF